MSVARVALPIWRTVVRAMAAEILQRGVCVVQAMTAEIHQRGVVDVHAMAAGILKR